MTPVEGHSQDREFLPGTWRLEGGVPPSDHTELWRPGEIRAARGLIVVADYGDASLKAFGPDGQLRWKAGRRGKGPQEFSLFGGISITGDGRVLVTDIENARISELDASGRFIAEQRLDRIPDRAVRLDPTRLALRYAFESFPLIVDNRASQVRVPQVPDSVRAVSPYVRAGRLVALPDARVAMVFKWSSTFYLIDTTGSVQAVTGPDRVPFPASVAWDQNSPIGRITRVGPHPSARPVYTYADVTEDGDLLLQVSDGSEGTAAIIDRHDGRTGRYLGSYRLPETIESFAWDRGRLVALINDPVPQVKVWRFIPGKAGTAR